jgi:hypothetical protein
MYAKIKGQLGITVYSFKDLLSAWHHIGPNARYKTDKPLTAAQLRRLPRRLAECLGASINDGEIGLHSS